MQAHLHIKSVAIRSVFTVLNIEQNALGPQGLAANRCFFFFNWTFCFCDPDSAAGLALDAALCVDFFSRASTSAGTVRPSEIILRAIAMHSSDVKVSSMSKVVKDNQGNLEKCREEVHLMLTEYFNRYFNNVEVTVYIPNGNESFHKGELVLSAELTNHDGTIVQLHEVMTDKGTLTRKFLDYQS